MGEGLAFSLLHTESLSLYKLKQSPHTAMMKDAAINL